MSIFLLLLCIYFYCFTYVSLVYWPLWNIFCVACCRCCYSGILFVLLLFVFFSSILVVLEKKLSTKAFSVQKSRNKSRSIQTMKLSCHNIETLKRKTKWFLSRCHFFTTKFKGNEASKTLFKFIIIITKGLRDTNKQMNSIQELEKVSSMKKWEVIQWIKRESTGKNSAKKLKFKKYRNEKLSE